METIAGEAARGTGEDLPAAGVEVPTTLEEFTEAAVALQTANPSGAANFSCFWFPGQDWYNGTAWIYTHGGELAVQEGDEWQGALSSPESQEALAEVQRLFAEGTNAPVDADGADFLVWQRQLGLPAPAIAASAAVPEPATLAMVVLGLPTIVLRLRMRA